MNNKIYFKERQVNWFVNLFMVGFVVWMWYAYVYQIGSHPFSLGVFIVLSLLFLFIVALFCKMDTTVYEDRVEIVYGLGIIKRRFGIEELTFGHCKEIPLWWGAGIKDYGGGTLYSINFTNAAEFRLKHRTKSIAVGSRTPQVLVQAVNEIIEKNLNK